ncbi:MAG: helix-turn-helix transcriptional regulator [Saprospiraceae bacterium]|nr:helix-turn-helix transcriptional regulator [Saprospiraceae bacterium]
MSPRRKEQVEEIRLKSTQLIVDAALNLFAHQGFYRTTISQIAKQAGISKGLIYNYFASKEQLLEAILDQAMHTGDEVLETLQSPEMDPELALDQAIDQIFDLVKANPIYWRLITALSFQEDIISKYKTKLEKHGQDNLTRLTSLLVKMGVDNPEMEAMYLAASLDGILLHFINFQAHYPIEEMRSFLKIKLRNTQNQT